MREKKKLGESLLEAGLLTEEQLKKALDESRKTGERVGQVLTKLGFISEETSLEFLGKQYGYPHVKLSNVIIENDVVKSIPETLVREHKVLPIEQSGRKVTIATSDPLNIFAIDDIEKKTGMEVSMVMASSREIKAAIDEYYSSSGSMEDVLRQFSTISKDESGEKLQELTAETPVIRLVNKIIHMAISENASDIHFEIDDKNFRIRNRIDGILYEKFQPPLQTHQIIISRLKIMASLDIAERRLPQDGRFQILYGNREIDFRISTLPTLYGENAVVRILSTADKNLSIDNLGFDKKIVDSIRRIAKRSTGFLLVTGPTGCGKTSTLYSLIKEINSMDKKIITLEDPVENRLPLVNQIQINQKIGLDFATGLRNILRNDPDIIMVGEVRDADTAKLAVESSLTGHMVFSTLHTNDAPQTITRLIEIGIEPYLVSSALSAVLAQRLIRKICPHCKTEYQPADALVKKFFPADSPKFYKGAGCKTCNGSGYLGRCSIGELLIITEEIQSAVITGKSIADIRDIALKSGMRPMIDDGIEKVREGVTTIEEIERIVEMEM